MVSPFCTSSVMGMFGLPPPPASASSTSVCGTTRKRGNSCFFGADERKAEPKTSNSTRDPCITVEASRHFFSIRLI